MNTTDYTAYIIENPDDDFLSPVDLRTLDSDRLRSLRDEGDYDMVRLIDEILDARL